VYHTRQIGVVRLFFVTNNRVEWANFVRSNLSIFLFFGKQKP